MCGTMKLAAIHLLVASTIFPPTSFLCVALSLTSKNVAKPAQVSSSTKVANPKSCVTFESPLLEAGYPPAVSEYRANTLRNKPLLLYLPGFDGTLLAPFLQFPELSTEFDVKGLTVGMSDRSTVKDLKEIVLDFIENQTKDDLDRPVYIIGESFGGLLTLEVVLAIQERNLKEGSPGSENAINLQGISLINPATCYNESTLAKNGPRLTRVSPMQYPFELMKLLPLFTDDYGLSQLLLILQSKGLPSVIDNEQREAYMGRMAFSLPTKMKFMPQATLKWRLEEWLANGCEAMNNKEDLLGNANVPVLIVAGELDNTLPSMKEAKRLSGLFKNTRTMIHCTPGAGHAHTVGSRVDLTALMRMAFYDRLKTDGRTEMKESARLASDEFYGMEGRYDNAMIGLMPTKYWSDDNFQSINLEL